MKKSIIIIVAIVVLAILGFFIFNKTSQEKSENQNQEETVEKENTVSTTTEEKSLGQSEEGQRVIGKSVNGNDINAYTYGTGDTHLLFVGGIHGGYSWNTALVAYELIDYLNENRDTLAENLKITVVPVLNPDGLDKVVGTTGRFARSAVPVSESQTILGRFNGNDVDLNRNFDCDWQAEGRWQTRTVSGGTAVFSEPESQAIKKYIETNRPNAVLVWYSAVGGVFASNCHEGVLSETKELVNVFANASGYKPYEEFDFYEITGDMTNWLAKIGVPAISVLLTTHEAVEWDKNLKGIQAMFGHYTENQ